MSEEPVDDTKPESLVTDLTEHQKNAFTSGVIKAMDFDARTYEIETRYREAQSVDEIHTLVDLVRFAEKDASIEIDARVLALGPDGMRIIQMDKKQFCETFRKNTRFDRKKFREASRRMQEGANDYFAIDDAPGTPNAGLMGDDYTPLLGGPFNKQLYLADYLKMISICYQAWNHDAIAKRSIEIIRDFTLGRGWRVDVQGKDKEIGNVLWRAFEEVNNLYNLMDYAAIELSLYGEILCWELPDGQTGIEYKVQPGQEVPRDLLPRWRLIDPSCIWEIVTYPEDITRVLYYQWVAPTQYQLLGGNDAGSQVPTTKFIVQQIPADQVVHTKVNVVSNEKRGRSDLFCVLGDLKRLRDSINYSIIGDLKNAAWCIDTQIQGSQADINNYIASQQQTGAIAPAGSEFVHSEFVTRTYLNNQGGGRNASLSFEWCLSKVAAGLGIPISYFGTHLSNTGSRAGAIVATEPVAKRFEHRQYKFELLIRTMGRRLFKKFGIDADIEVTFPEIITQDRSQKMQDLALAEEMKWIKPERAATIAAKEFGITDYEYESEQDEISDHEKAQATAIPMPLSTPGQQPTQPTKPKIPMDKQPQNQPQAGGQAKPKPQAGAQSGKRKPTALTSGERRAVKKTDKTL